MLKMFWQERKGKKEREEHGRKGNTNNQKILRNSPKEKNKLIL